MISLVELKILLLMSGDPRQRRAAVAHSMLSPAVQAQRPPADACAQCVGDQLVADHHAGRLVEVGEAEAASVRWTTPWPAGAAGTSGARLGGAPCYLWCLLTGVEQ